MLDLIYKYSVLEKNFTTTNMNASLNPNLNLNYTNAFTPLIISTSQIKIFKHINLFFLVHEEEDLNEYNKYYKILNKSNSAKDFNFFIKFLFYDKFKGVINSDDFYGDLKNYNSKLTFEELTDEESINLLILNDKSTKANEVFFNKDINNDIYVLNLENLEENLTFTSYLDRLIGIRTLDHDIKSLINTKSEENNNLVDEIIKINNSKQVKFAKMLTQSLSNLDKINKIFALYESIRTLEHIKQKFNDIQANLIELVKNNFTINKSQMELVMKIYIDTFYLMNSSELVSYEHFFSFEFKIGMFLPPMLPIMYGLVKAIKALTS